ncbi:hypothetical protein KY347_05560 [Candidatus Woesearchaeota archaeon]|nr:hypothetical protein [Candidatus Woesearchaeota archaeon]
MNKKLALLHRRVKVRYSKKRRKGRITLSVPRKFEGYSAVIIIYPKKEIKF